MARFRAKIILILTLIFILLFGIALKLESHTAPKRPFTIKLANNTGTEQTIELWSENETSYYMFLPPYASSENIQITNNTKGELYIDDKPLSFENIIPDKQYHLYSHGDSSFTGASVTFMQSKNVASMFLTSATGNLDEVYSDKKHKERVLVSLVDTDGNTNYQGIGDDIIRGRGNSTWLADKKPFNLILNQPESILGMNPSVNWALLANAYDSTCTRDKLVKDISENLFNSYVPNATYLDLYINGVYNGLYTISEKPTIEENRVQLPPDGVLSSFELESRIENSINYLVTDNDQTIIVKYPEKCSDKDLDEIFSKLQNAEDVILGTSSNQNLDEVIDIDSWARMYLIDEIFQDQDAAKASSYMYWTQKDSKIYRGPVWDYDLTAGARIPISNAESFFAKRRWKAPDIYTPYYDSLLKDETFRDAVTQLYYNEFEPVIRDYINNTLPTIKNNLRYCLSMNYLRWKEQYDGNDTALVKNIDDLTDYLNNRLDFLSDSLPYINEYNTVYVNYLDEEDYYCISVKNGQTVDLPSPDFFEIENFSKWIVEDTGEEFNIDLPITQDIKIKAEVKEEKNLFERIINHKSLLFQLGSIGTFLLILIMLIYIDIKQRGQ